VRNHAQAIVACDFFVVVTARFRILYVFVLMELGRRRILHVNVTDNPSAEWTQQQLREALPGDHPFRFLIHDRDSIFSQELDEAVAAMGVRVLRTPFRASQANAVCERLIGTIRRECLDFLIPLGQRHLKNILNRWVHHYNHGRVHMTLGQVFRRRFIPHRPDQIIDTTFREVIECIANPCWADCIMSTGWKRSRHEHERSLCAPQRSTSAGGRASPSPLSRERRKKRAERFEQRVIQSVRRYRRRPPPGVHALR
jgi:hypothetical protein